MRELGLKEPLRGLLSLEPLLGLLEASRRFLALRRDGEDPRHGHQRGEEVRSSTHGDWLYVTNYQEEQCLEGGLIGSTDIIWSDTSKQLNSWETFCNILTQ